MHVLVHLASRTDMEENLDRMLDKLDRILELARDVNFTLKLIDSRDESRHMNNVPSMILESRELLRMSTFLLRLLV